MMSSTPIIDAHVHIFPPSMTERREQLLREDAWFGEAFGHPGARMRTVEQLIERMDITGVDISVIVGWPWGSNELCREHNDYLADATSRFPDRIVWLGIINPVATGAAIEIARCLELGASGFGEINADGQGFRWSEPDEYRDVLLQITESGLPFMCHTSEPVGHRYPGKGYAHPEEILTAIEEVPLLKWVLAHWGGGLPFYELMPEVKLACANVAYDSAATSHLYDPNIFRRTIDLVGVDKVIFGSDWPVLGQAKLLDLIRSLGLSSDELAAVLGGNATRIYGIS